MPDLWYKNAVIYCVDVDTFLDADGDGVGDFRGLTDRLDHIEALGANCIWLLPFYPTPDRDNGYDIIDYYSVEPRLGTLGDFVDFTHAAHDRGLRVIVDLVVNHTSIDHPWFQASRSDPESRYRDWYVWSKTKPADAEEGVIFPGVQESTWTFDETRQEFYFHRFYEHQADLNIANPQVREEIERIMGFWLALGVSGFRIDAVPFILEGLEGPQSEGDPHAYLAEMHKFLAWRRSEAIMLAEANIPMDKADEYFGNGDRLHLVFNFLLNQKLFLSFARGDAQPTREILQTLPSLPDTGQWATFLRNHDEIDLGRLEDDEREEVFAAFGPEKHMQIYDRGIRRRLAPMLGGDKQRLAMAQSLMLALPGTPVFWYGDEIGMGEDLSLQERQSVRTPMQWSNAPNGGFSSAAAKDCIRPPIAEGPFGFPAVNAESQRIQPDSLLSIVQQLVRVRRSCPEIGWGSVEVLELSASSVLGLVNRWRGGTVVTLHNLSGEPAEVEFPEQIPFDDLRPLLAKAEGSGEPRAGKITLPAYGYEWLRLGQRR